MVVFEVITEIIFKDIIFGTFKSIFKGINYLWYKITGRKFSKSIVNTKAGIKKQFLYKKVELTSDLNSTLKKGQIGAIIEIIDDDTMFAEFYDNNKRIIDVDNELVFKVKKSQIRTI